MSVLHRKFQAVQQHSRTSESHSALMTAEVAAMATRHRQLNRLRSRSHKGEENSQKHVRMANSEDVRAAAEYAPKTAN